MQKQQKKLENLKGKIQLPNIFSIVGGSKFRPRPPKGLEDKSGPMPPTTT